VAAAWAYGHSTNGVIHGLDDTTPVAFTFPPGNQFSTVEMRHYSPDGSYNVQCASFNNGNTTCSGSFGSLPCQKRSVNGTDGLLSRHWVRKSGCPGQIHAGVVKLSTSNLA
jgi:hypothetical protein